MGKVNVDNDMYQHSYGLIQTYPTVQWIFIVCDKCQIQQTVIQILGSVPRVTFILVGTSTKSYVSHSKISILTQGAKHTYYVGCTL